MTALPEPVPFALNWDDVDAMDVHPVNQILTQVALPGSAGQPPDSIYLALGHVSPPVLVENEQVRQRAMERYAGQLSVRPYGRFVMTRGRAEELVALLGTALEQLEVANSISPVEPQTP